MMKSFILTILVIFPGCMPKKVTVLSEIWSDEIELQVAKLTEYDLEITQKNVSNRKVNILSINSADFMFHVLDKNGDTVIHDKRILTNFAEIILNPGEKQEETFDIYAYILRRDKTLPHGEYYFQIESTSNHRKSKPLKFKYNKLKYDPLRWKLPVEILNDEVFINGDTMSFSLVNNSTYDIKSKDILLSYLVTSSVNCFEMVASDTFYYEPLYVSKRKFNRGDTVEWKVSKLNKEYLETKELKSLNRNCNDYVGPRLSSKKYPFIRYLNSHKSKYIYR